MVEYDSGIYAPGPIKPIVKIRENISVWTLNAWEHYRAEFIEPMPKGAAMTVDMVAVAGTTTLAANATIAKRLLGVLQLNAGEFLHLRWEPIDNVEGVLWEQAGQGRSISRGVQARVDRSTKGYDPYLATTTFWILGRDRDMNLEARNPMGYAIPTARFAFWGYRYILTSAVPAAASELDKAALKAGDMDTVRRVIGATTWVPAEGRAA